MGELAPHTPLYRFIRVDRLLDLLSTRSLVLCRPHRWGDPFENFLSNTSVEEDGRLVGFDLTNDFFGQCWTLKEECDGMWRNYCGLDDGVRIGTTAIKLIQAIWDSAAKYASLRTFVGTVEYLHDDQIKSELEHVLAYGHWLMDSTGKGLARALLIKRAEFAYEHEVRALISDPNHKDDYKRIPISPASFIDSVMLAPKLNQSKSAECTARLHAAGMPSSKVCRSTLYDPWKLRLPKNAK